MTSVCIVFFIRKSSVLFVIRKMTSNRFMETKCRGQNLTHLIAQSLPKGLFIYYVALDWVSTLVGSENVIFSILTYIYWYINHPYILGRSERVQKPAYILYKWSLTKDRIRIGCPADYLLYYYSTFSNNNNQMKLLRNLKFIFFTWLGLKFITWLYFQFQYQMTHFITLSPIIKLRNYFN